jgi:hypothetical protein
MAPSLLEQKPFALKLGAQKRKKGKKEKPLTAPHHLGSLYWVALRMGVAFLVPPLFRLEPWEGVPCPGQLS